MEGTGSKVVPCAFALLSVFAIIRFALGYFFMLDVAGLRLEHFSTLNITLFVCGLVVLGHDRYINTIVGRALAKAMAKQSAAHSRELAQERAAHSRDIVEERTAHSRELREQTRTYDSVAAALEKLTAEMLQVQQERDADDLYRAAYVRASARANHAEEMQKRTNLQLEKKDESIRKLRNECDASQKEIEATMRDANEEKKMHEKALQVSTSKCDDQQKAHARAMKLEENEKKMWYDLYVDAKAKSDRESATIIANLRKEISDAMSQSDKKSAAEIAELGKQVANYKVTVDGLEKDIEKLDDKVEQLEASLKRSATEVCQGRRERRRGNHISRRGRPGRRIDASASFRHRYASDGDPRVCSSDECPCHSAIRRFIYSRHVHYCHSERSSSQRCSYDCGRPTRSYILDNRHSPCDDSSGSYSGDDFVPTLTKEIL